MLRAEKDGFRTVQRATRVEPPFSVCARAAVSKLRIFATISSGGVSSPGHAGLIVMPGRAGAPVKAAAMASRNGFGRNSSS
jgi:hypothetical protein